MNKMNKIEAIILDWAGTAVDFGCFAPVRVFIDIFRQAGVEVTLEEARAPMGMLKIDHIRAMLSMPRVAALWEAKYNRPFNEGDVEELYAVFEPALMASLSEYTDPIPGVLETVEALRADGLKIGSTTGYTSSMMEVVASNAREKGYRPDHIVTPDDTGSFGRPYPYMIFRNMEQLKLSAAWKVVKVGDTISDMKEGVNAGVWTVGVAVGSSELGHSLESFHRMTEPDKQAAIAKTKQTFLEQGADFAIGTMSGLPLVVGKINELLAQGKRPGCKV